MDQHILNNMVNDKHKNGPDNIIKNKAVVSIIMILVSREEATNTSDNYTNINIQQT